MKLAEYMGFKELKVKSGDTGWPVKGSEMIHGLVSYSTYLLLQLHVFNKKKLGRNQI